MNTTNHPDYKHPKTHARTYQLLLETVNSKHTVRYSQKGRQHNRKCYLIDESIGEFKGLFVGEKETVNSVGNVDWLRPPFVKTLM